MIKLSLLMALFFIISTKLTLAGTHLSISAGVNLVNDFSDSNVRNDVKSRRSENEESNPIFNGEIGLHTSFGKLSLIGLSVNSWKIKYSKDDHDKIKVESKTGYLSMLAFTNKTPGEGTFFRTDIGFSETRINLLDSNDTNLEERYYNQNFAYRVGFGTISKLASRFGFIYTILYTQHKIGSKKAQLASVQAGLFF
jgi:hypothetical protein